MTVSGGVSFSGVGTTACLNSESNLFENSSAQLYPGEGAAESGSGEVQHPWRHGARGDVRTVEGPVPRVTLIPGPGVCLHDHRQAEHSSVPACTPPDVTHADAQYEYDSEDSRECEYVDAIGSNGIVTILHVICDGLFGVACSRSCHVKDALVKAVPKSSIDHGS